MNDVTKAPAEELPDPRFRQTIEVAEGPNVTGHDDMVKLAHTLPPDPEIVEPAKDLLLPPAPES